MTQTNGHKGTPIFARLLALTLTAGGVAAAQGTALQFTLPQPLQLRVQALPNFGGAPLFKSLDSAASARFLNGNTIWFTAAALEEGRVRRQQQLTANVARLQPLAAQPRIQAVLRAAQLQGLAEPLLTVQTNNGPLTVKLQGADVGASLAVRSLGQDAGRLGQEAAAQAAQEAQVDPALVSRVAQAAPQQRLNVVTQLRSDLSRTAAVGVRQVDPALLAPAGVGSGLDTVPSSCPPRAAGLFALADFPLKKNLPAVKNQGARGTCWGFASVGLAETLIDKTFKRRVDLSEEDYVAYSKLKYGAPDDADGADTNAVLTANAQNAYRFAFENVWQYNQSLSRTATETPAKSGKYVYARSCLNYPFQDQCEDTVSQAETGCIVAAGKTVCGAQIPTDRTPYGLDTGYMRNVWDWDSPEGGMGWAVLALSLGTPVLLTHDARYLTNTQGFVADLDYSAVSHPEGSGSAQKFVPNKAEDVQWWNHVALLVGWIGNDQLAKTMPGAPAGAGGGYFIMKNSWGSCFGDGGYVYLPWNWVKKYGGGLTMGVRVTRN